VGSPLSLLLKQRRQTTSCFLSILQLSRHFLLHTRRNDHKHLLIADLPPAFMSHVLSSPSSHATDTSLKLLQNMAQDWKHKTSEACVTGRRPGPRICSYHSIELSLSLPPPLSRSLAPRRNKIHHLSRFTPLRSDHVPSLLPPPPPPAPPPSPSLSSPPSWPPSFLSRTVAQGKLPAARY